MSDTKTYPLSAIMGEETDEYERGYAQGCEEGKERIAELADAFNRVCDENADFVAESIKADRRIAELEADVMEFRSRGNVAMSSWDEERERALREGERVVALETDVKDLHADIARLTTEAYTQDAEVKTLRKDAERYRWLRDVAPKGTGEIADIRSNHSTDEINAAIDAAREGK